MNACGFIALGVSTVMGGNVVAMGAAIDARLRQLESQRPIGMEIGVISHQADAVTASVNGFVVNLLQAVAIVIVVLLFFMGLKAGLIIGGILALTISGTLFLMDYNAVMLERISLGALIIALGMLVDNAIVIVDNIYARMEEGMDRFEAAWKGARELTLPVLVSTLTSIAIFTPLAFMPSLSGEFIKSIPLVVGISLLASFVVAMTITPLIFFYMLKVRGRTDERFMTRIWNRIRGRQKKRAGAG